jgi:hypothetical protein
VLSRILNRLRSGGTWTVDVLARELGTSPRLVEAAIEDLARRGYLAPVSGPCASGACDHGCAACPAAGSCVRGSVDRVWTLV